jgi:hypothetical protein
LTIDSRHDWRWTPTTNQDVNDSTKGAGLPAHAARSPRHPGRLVSSALRFDHLPPVTWRSFALTLATPSWFLLTFPWIPSTSAVLLSSSSPMACAPRGQWARAHALMGSAAVGGGLRELGHDQHVALPVHGVCFGPDFWKQNPVTPSVQEATFPAPNKGQCSRHGDQLSTALGVQRAGDKRAMQVDGGESAPQSAPSTPRAMWTTALPQPPRICDSTQQYATLHTGTIHSSTPRQ